MHQNQLQKQLSFYHLKGQNSNYVEVLIELIFLIDMDLEYNKQNYNHQFILFS
jgi:hypothetical protein